MQEDFLHYIWKHSAFSNPILYTYEGQVLTIQNLGQHNFNSGPDFFNAQIRIDEQLWAGNVEIHVKSSDWYLHNHQSDMAYDNVILHVVWEYDAAIFRRDNTEIPTLELKNLVEENLYSNYKKLMQSKTWINCEKDFHSIDEFHLNNWLERLYVERLERKFNEISLLLSESRNDWEAVLFKMLLKNFGLRVNSDAFLSIANSIDYSAVRKLQYEVTDLEALLFGQARLLIDDIEDYYYKCLQERYKFLKRKFKLENDSVIQVKYFRLRPANFPTIRLSQFASLYSKERQLFSKLIQLEKKDELYDLFSYGVSDFWKSHYTFNTKSGTSTKTITRSLIDLIVINTIIPLKFCYHKLHSNTMDEVLLDLAREISLENNTIVNKFFDLRPMAKNALTSQGLLELKQNYCDKNKCLQCAVGNRLIVKN
ncbi:DUF2851 family protein [Winogradskyella tangerina]|uniref:DUF2851 family protein n=1 Tax=Winogradskyella tangerina TaxID=2023240 RepID=UPI000DBE2CDD|nr:DUF2851 family protein [Winogradskyella tangerina]